MSKLKSSGQAQDATSEGVISLENIDAILAEESPDFASQMQELEQSGSEFQPVSDENLDVEVDTDLSKETLRSKGGKLLKKLMANKALRVVVRLWVGLRNLFWRTWMVILRKSQMAFRSLKDWVRQAPFTALEYGRFQASRFRSFRKSVQRSYEKRTRKEKWLLLIFVFLLIATCGLISLTIKENWMNFGSQKVLTSMAEVADQSWTYNVNAETTPFLTAFPQPRHSFLFQKVVVNLKKKISSLGEAMGAFEFFVEVDSKDAARELKGRETELRDVMQRSIEEFTYESLQTEKGKARLKEKIRADLNRELAQGWVKEVFIKFMVTKP